MSKPVFTTPEHSARARVDQTVESPRVHHQWLPDMIWAEDRSALELEKATRRSTSVVAADHAAQKRLRLRADVVHADQAHVAGVVRRAARRAREAPMCEANPACVWNENEECGNA